MQQKLATFSKINTILNNAWLGLGLFALLTSLRGLSHVPPMVPK